MYRRHYEGANGLCERGLPSLNTLGFAGEQQDPTGLYNLRARAYDPTIGQMLTTDPFDHSTAAPLLSAYGYADGAPSSLVDPSGMTAQGSGVWQHTGEFATGLLYAGDLGIDGARLGSGFSSWGGSLLKLRGLNGGAEWRDVSNMTAFARTPGFKLLARGADVLTVGYAVTDVGYQLYERHPGQAFENGADDLGPLGAGLAVTGGCEVLTGGVGTPVCMIAGAGVSLLAAVGIEVL